MAQGTKYYPGAAFAADNSLKAWPAQSRLWRAYMAGYLAELDGNPDPSTMPGKLTDKNSERYAYNQGATDAGNRVRVTWLNEVPPEEPPPETPTEEGGMESQTSDTTDPLFIPGGDNG